MNAGRHSSGSCIQAKIEGVTRMMHEEFRSVKIQIFSWLSMHTVVVSWNRIKFCKFSEKFVCSVCSCLSGCVIAHKPLMKAVQQSKRLAYNHSLSILAYTNSYLAMLSSLF